MRTWLLGGATLALTAGAGATLAVAVLDAVCAVLLAVGVVWSAEVTAGELLAEGLMNMGLFWLFAWPAGWCGRQFSRLYDEDRNAKADADAAVARFDRA